ncbi:hypothetical protein D3C74_452770 [compost metagenome]
MKKRKEYMDVQMLKRTMAERQQTSNKLELLEQLLHKKTLHNADKVLLKEKDAQ